MEKLKEISLVESRLDNYLDQSVPLLYACYSLVCVVGTGFISAVCAGIGGIVTIFLVGYWTSTRHTKLFAWVMGILALMTIIGVTSKQVGIYYDSNLLQSLQGTWLFWFVYIAVLLMAFAVGRYSNRWSLEITGNP